MVSPLLEWGIAQKPICANCQGTTLSESPAGRLVSVSGSEPRKRGSGHFGSRLFLGLSVWLCGVHPLVHASPWAVALQDPQSDPGPLANLPTGEQVQSRQTQLATATTVAEADKKVLEETYSRIQENLRQLAEISVRRKKLTEQLERIPQELKSTKFELEQAPLAIPQVADNVPLERIRQLKSQKDAELAAARATQSDQRSRFDNRNSRRTQASEQVTSLRTKLQEFEATPAPDASNPELSPQLLEALQWDRQVSLELTREKLQFYQQDLLASEAEEELLPLQVQLSARNVARLEEEVALLAQAISSRRESQVENTLRVHAESLLADNLTAEQSVVLRLGNIWTDVVRQHGQAEREKRASLALNENLSRDLAQTRETIRKDLLADGALRSGLGMKLQRQRGRLPDVSDIKLQIAAVDARIEEMGALQAQLQLTIDELNGRGLRDGPTILDGNEIAIQREIARLGELDRDIDSYTNDLIEWKDLLGQTQSITKEFYREIDSNVLWIRNLRPYSFADINTGWHSFQWILAPSNWRLLGEAYWMEIKGRPDIVLLWLAITGLLIGLGPRLRSMLRELGDRASKRNQASMRPTFRALWITALLALPIVSVFAFPAWQLSNHTGESNYARSVGQALMVVALAAFPIEFARQFFRPRGLAISHFGLKSERAQVVRSSLRFLLDIGIPVTILWGIADSSGNTTISSSLARPLFAAGMALIGFAIWRVSHPHYGLMSDVIARRPGGWLDRLRYVWHPGITGIPILLTLLSMSGYSYSAIKLTEQLYWTFWLLLTLAVVGGLMRRWVTVSRRSLLLAQARQRATNAERLEGAPVDLVPEMLGPDLSEINAQTLRLIHAFLVVLTIVGLATMWSPVLPAVRFLDSIGLWGSGAIDSNGKEIPVTLGSLLSSLPIILLTFVSVRNVPGLVESLLLQKLPLQNAARYAITTMSSYALLLFGVVVSAKTLGLKWESIQWLVAALGVGLGFGLQEIFANFISGIILLFEQPIRVGDVVTIDGTTGAVSRIRMRATTVTNWDRQELIIPNKDLITGRLINWTLSDSTNRIVLNINVAHGSDTRRACALLEGICKDNSNVIDDPAPIIALDNFGESSLNIVVRCFLKSIDVRVQTIHELLTEINDRFRDEGIKFALPQREVHIRTLPNRLSEFLANPPAKPD
jgi:potassium efflux system protein